MYSELSGGKATLKIVESHEVDYPTDYSVFQLSFSESMDSELKGILIESIVRSCNPHEVYSGHIRGQKEEVISQVNNILDSVELDSNTNFSISINKGLVRLVAPPGVNPIIRELDPAR
jgi:hypothetical protein